MYVPTVLLLQAKLASKLLLVVAYAALVATHLLRLAHPDLASHLVNQTEVVAHEHDAALVRVDRTRQTVHSVDVQVVRGLVQKKKVHGTHAQHRKHQARTLAVAQQLDRRLLLPRGEPERVQVTAPNLLRALNHRRGELALHKCEWAQLHVQHIHAVLVVLTHHQVLMAAHGALRWRQLTGHQPEQSALAASVRTHQCHPRVAVNAQIQVLVQNRVRVAFVLARICK
mmetsp:Transcript_12493/g.28363  ORF Transcript_12493/g.28363 Transcript_12493/m.28363 type:complete len:227 (+) Transcript_12493:120-800(+)